MVDSYWVKMIGSAKTGLLAFSIVLHCNLVIHNLLSEQTMKFGLIVSLAYSCLLKYM